MDKIFIYCIFISKNCFKRIVTRYYKNKGNIVGDSSSSSGSFIAGGNISVGGNVSNTVGKYDKATLDAMSKIQALVRKSGNKEAKEYFNRFNDEMRKEKPDKVNLKSFWSSLERVLPSVNQIAGVAANILPLFR
jgi:hypothetical protein